MPWLNRGNAGTGYRPWRRAEVQHIYDELHAIRAMATAIVSACSAHGLLLGRLDARVETLERLISDVRAATVTIPPPPPPGVPTLADARARRAELDAFGEYT